MPLGGGRRAVDFLWFRGRGRFWRACVGGGMNVCYSFITVLVYSVRGVRGVSLDHKVPSAPPCLLSGPLLWLAVLGSAAVRRMKSQGSSQVKPEDTMAETAYLCDSEVVGGGGYVPL